MGILTRPWEYVYSGRCDENPDNINNFTLYTMDKTRRTGSSKKSMEFGSHKHLETEVVSFDRDSYKKLFVDDKTRYLQPIECGQYITNNDQRMKAVMQPSLHVGVCPVPQLTTTHSGLVADKFTDLKCLQTFDIDTEIILEFGMPFSYTHYDEPHIEAEHHLDTIHEIANKDMFREDLSSFNNQFITTQ